MPSLRCPSCDAPNVAGETFCNSCGKPLPTIAPAARPQPRRATPQSYSAEPLERDALAGRPARPEPLSYEDEEEQGVSRANDQQLKKLAKAAASPLFAVAVIMLICGAVSAFVLPNLMHPEAPAEEKTVAILAGLIVIGGMCVVFAGLGWWAYYQPLPPTIIGLVLFILYALADTIASFAQGVPFAGIIIKVILVVGLIKGVKAALEYNQVKRHADW